MSTLKGRPKVRPRPRAQASQEPGLDELRDERQSSRSVHSKSPSLSAIASPSKTKQSGNFQRTSSNTTATVYDDDLDDDDDDFFLNKSKPVNSYKTAPMNYDDEDEEDELMDDSQDTPQYKKRRKDHKAAYHAEWARKAPKRKNGRLDSDIDDSDNDVPMSDSTADGSPGARKASKGPAQHQEKKKARQRSASLELTPPPTIDPEKIANLQKVVSNFIKNTGGAQEDINDGSAMDDLFNNQDFNKTIHPDLLATYRGRNGAQLRQRMREQQPIPTPTQAPNPMPRTAVSTKHNARDAIELSDSDDNAPVQSVKRTLRSNVQNNRDSSPIEVTEVRRTTNNVQSDTKIPLISTTNHSAPNAPKPSDSAIAIAPPAEESAPAEEEERISVILKAEGGLQISVKVKQTTLVGTLLNHFINTHRDKIPKDRVSKVRIRFDGDILLDKQTMQDLDVDEDDQLDIVW